ncbi:hypothetical protein D9758_004743 [Tetrapyrgos nigripes]|uniref:DH domain-containing protein n=1 Tax=Tetrapyrgos nigripes TaxID=182062 RepID=A0A8H5G5X3_9AGAR|nr:hypothetical protein D9758_004743 [Tetrapyrgos nigripes]
MALRSSPRKVVPLATGDEIKPRSTFAKSSTTKRVFFCGVVVEGSEGGGHYQKVCDYILVVVQAAQTYFGVPVEIQDLVLSLGEVVGSESENDILAAAHKRDSESNFTTRKRKLTDTSALTSAINELVTTEQSYVKRLRTLKQDYADPLRKFAKNKNTAILDKYEAKTLFGNIDNLLPVNEAFLTDLEKMCAPNGARTVGGVGDVALKHFKELSGFEQYKQYYVKREEAQRIFEREVAKRGSPFGNFIDHIKYQSADMKNRIGLPSIEGFPPELISNSRCFIDCIDVEDVLLDQPLSSSASVSSSSSSLHCSLFLFDDKLLLVKRPSGDKGGRALAGLDDIDKITKSSGIPNGRKRSGMVCKGVFDVTDIAATDVGSSDFHLYLENPPNDQTERWSGRPFRSYSVVEPPPPGNLDPTQTEKDKQRFLENLWMIQAKYRAKLGQSVVLRSEEFEVDSSASSGKTTFARTYYNVYTRTAFLQEAKKTKIVVHIDAHGTADDIPFGVGSPPFAVIRIKPLAGELCCYKVTSSDPSDPGEDDVLQTGRVPGRIPLTIPNWQEFSAYHSHCPLQGLDIRAGCYLQEPIQRSPGSAMDFFSGSVSGRKRTKSTASRSSTYTHTTTTADSSITKYSLRSHSTATAATTVEDDPSIYGTPPGTVKKLQKHRGRSPGGAVSETEASFRRSITKSTTRSSRTSRSVSRDRDSDHTDMDDDDDDFFRGGELDTSDQDLALQLELARRNSKNQNDAQVRRRAESPTDAPIYEEENPFSLRPPSRASNSTSQCTIRADARSPSPRPRSLSRDPLERRPLGPRSPSPLPPSRSPRPPSPVELPSMDASDELTAEISSIVSPSIQPSRPSTGIPRSKRQPLHPTGNQATPRAGPSGVTSPVVEPLSIKKKTSLRDQTVTSTPVRKSGRNSLSRTPGNKVMSHRRVSPQVRAGKSLASSASTSGSPSRVAGDLDKVVRLVQTTKEDIESSNRSVKRIKLEVNRQRSADVERDISRPSSPVKGLRTPQRDTPMSKAAQDRLEEMRQLIGQRSGGDLTPRNRPQSVFSTPLRAHHSVDSPAAFAAPMSSLEPLISEAETKLDSVLSNQEVLLNTVHRLQTSFKERATEHERAKIELQNSKRQLEVVKSLLTDATNEKEIMYEAFNEELDSMYNDVNLPEDEAWTAMTRDLKATKTSRNTLAQENSELKRRLAEVELQKEEWGALLRHHGLIP